MDRNIIIVIIILFLLALFLTGEIIVIRKLNYYEDRVYDKTYIGEYNISNVKYKDLNKKVQSINDELQNRKITLVYSENTIETTYKELGINIDVEKIVKDIKKTQEKENQLKKIKLLFGKKKRVYDSKIEVDEFVLNKYLQNVKETYDRAKEEEHFDIDDNRNITYNIGKSGLSLNSDESRKKIKETIEKGKENKIKLVYDEDKVENHENYKYIDTKVSSFTTEFNPYISRATNLRTGLSYIDGVILEPGEVFSFYKYAGPYNKRGYVFYYEFVGNGVCQIATTTYNAALLGGLEIVERYQHAEMVPYVKGGLDATVASYSSGWYVDMKFKNTYKYPIYISAYATGGVAHVDFWSNSNAKEGKEYQTESVKVSSLGYKSYLHVFENGQEIEKRFLANSWYREKTH